LGPQLKARQHALIWYLGRFFFEALRIDIMLRLVLAASLLLVGVTGCGGPNVDDPSRVPAGAVDTSDPSKSAMKPAEGVPAAPKGAQPGPPGSATP
jgi:hypothetical protein